MNTTTANNRGFRQIQVAQYTVFQDIFTWIPFLHNPMVYVVSASLSKHYA